MKIALSLCRTMFVWIIFCFFNSAFADGSAIDQVLFKPRPETQFFYIKVQSGLEGNLYVGSYEVPLHHEGFPCPAFVRPCSSIKEGLIGVTAAQTLLDDPDHELSVFPLPTSAYLVRFQEFDTSCKTTLGLDENELNEIEAILKKNHENGRPSQFIFERRDDRIVVLDQPPNRVDLKPRQIAEGKTFSDAFKNAVERFRNQIAESELKNVETVFQKTGLLDQESMRIVSDGALERIKRDHRNTGGRVQSLTRQTVRAVSEHVEQYSE